MYPKENDYFEISDTDADTVHKTHAFLIKSEKARFYAGAKIPLTAGDNRVGVLCVFDTSPRTLIGLQRDYLLGMAQIISKALVLQSNNGAS